MNLHKLFTFFYAAIIVLLIILGITTFLMKSNQDLLIQSQEIRFRSYPISEEIKKETEELSRYCKLYVSTGDKTWENKYWEVYNNRKRKRPKSNRDPFREVITKLKFKESELKEFEEAKITADELSILERKAIKAMNGLFEDSKGSYSIKKEPDPGYASKIIFSGKYLLTKEKMMNSIDSFLLAFDQKTEIELKNWNDSSYKMLGYIFALIITISLISIVSYLILRKRIIIKLEELSESEKKLKEAQALGHIGNWELDWQTKTISGSNEAANIYGIEKMDSSLPFSRVQQIVIPEHRLIFDDSIINFFSSLSVYDEEFQIKRFNDGEVRWIHLKAELVNDNQGRPNKVKGIIQDITNLKATEDALRELNATKDRFFSIIAHDLRSPYNAILGYLDLLINEYEQLSDEERITYIRNLSNLNRNTFRLLENLLEWSRLQLGRTSVNIENFNLFLQLHPAISLLKETALEKNITLKVSMNDIVEVKADKYMLETILRNLLSNAIKFTKPGGEVSVKTTKRGNEIEISISDNGVGIPSDNIDKLFRIEKNITTPGTCNEKGTGLGLILCKDMIEKQGGRIWVESEPDKGTTFYFTVNAA